MELLLAPQSCGLMTYEYLCGFHPSISTVLETLLMWLISIEIDHIRFKQEIFKTEEYTGTHTVSCYMIMPYGLQKIPYRLVREGEANRCFCITMEIISSSPPARCYRRCKDKSYQRLPGDSRPNLANHDLRNTLTDVKERCQEVFVLDEFILSFMIIVLTICPIFQPNAWKIDILVDIQNH